MQILIENTFCSTPIEELGSIIKVHLFFFPWFSSVLFKKKGEKVLYV